MCGNNAVTSYSMYKDRTAYRLNPGAVVYALRHGKIGKQQENHCKDNDKTRTPFSHFNSP